jgi:hypothetical protein
MRDGGETGGGSPRLFGIEFGSRESTVYAISVVELLDNLGLHLQLKQ